MSNLIQTKERLNSTKSTQKVIKAMELVASSKIKKAKEKALENETYFSDVTKIMKTIFSFEDMIQYLALDKCEDKTLIIGITSDMGLCGAYNNNVIKEVNNLIKDNPNNYTVMLGNKGINKLNYENITMKDTIGDISKIKDFDLAKQASDIIKTMYLEQKVNKVLIVYTKFVNPIVQEVEVLDLFGLESVKKEENQMNVELIVDGDRQKIFKNMLMQYINSVMYHAILNAVASEYAARRNSMEAANNNSLEIIDQLNLEMNRIRQSMITQEIAEIIGGAQALNEE